MTDSVRAALVDHGNGTYSMLCDGSKLMQVDLPENKPDMTDDRERALFEATCAQKHNLSVEQYVDGSGYVNHITKRMWNGWQARADIARRQAGA